VGGVLQGLLAAYFLAGLFSTASWLHTDGRRKGGKWVVFKIPHLGRIFIFTVFAYFAFRSFAAAFHRDFTRYYLPIDFGFVVAFLLVLLAGRRVKKNDAPN